MLSEEQVLEIYMAKVSLLNQDSALDTNKMQMIKGQSVRVSVMYGVTSRTIRDIWNRQSWAYVTRHLWCLEPQLGSEDVHNMPTIKVLLYPFHHLFSALS
jgi:hypothetical protein